jgi:hypothetical protein
MFRIRFRIQILKESVACIPVVRISVRIFRKTVELDVSERTVEFSIRLCKLRDWTLLIVGHLRIERREVKGTALGKQQR